MLDVSVTMTTKKSGKQTCQLVEDGKIIMGDDLVPWVSFELPEF